MQVGVELIAQFMRRICDSYVYWYNNKETIDDCLDMDERFCISDQEAGKIIQAPCKIKSGPELQKMEKTQRNIYLK
jgi:hypothetical protein